MICNRENAGGTHVNIREFRHNRIIFTEVIMRTGGRTDSRTNRQTNRSHKHFSTFVGQLKRGRQIQRRKKKIID